VADTDRATGESTWHLEPLADLSPARIWGMLESAPDAMLMTDEGGVMLAVNQQVEVVFGYDRVDLLGRSVDMLLPERFRNVHRAHRTRYGAAPTVRSMGVGLELRARRSDGSEFPVEVSLSPLHDADGLGVVVSVRDISDRVAVEARLERIQSAIDAVHDGVFMFEADSLKFVYANAGAVTQTGYARAELLEMTPLHIKPEFTRQQFIELIDPLIAGDVDHLSFRTVHRHKSGHDVPVDIMLEHRFDTSESTTALLVAVVRDVSDRVAIERQLATSEETFRTTFEHAPVGMMLTRIDLDGRRIIERANTSMGSMLGRSPESLRGVDVSEITHPDDDLTNARAAAQLADGSRDVYTTEKRYQRSDGSYVWTLLHATVIDRADSTITLAHLVDISDRRERQAEQDRLARMDDRDRIARDLHDLVIQRLFAAGMKLQSVIPQMGSDLAVSRTHETIDELDATIRELRSAIFDLHANDRPHGVSAGIVEVVETMSATLGFRPTLEMSEVDALAPKIVEELLSTLREALSNVGRHAQAMTAHVAISQVDDAVTLVVRDDGVGIRDDAELGNGLLNMAKRAERLGGACEVVRADTGGSRLTWSVPL
jgi:PAS domain S-box-containing protein